MADYIYDLTQGDGTTCVIVSSGDHTASGDIVIPSEYTTNSGTYTVVAIADFAFSDCPNLTSIVIPDTVTSIGKLAFYNCTGLTSVTLSKNLTTIGENAFADCTSLTSINLPASVTDIGRWALLGLAYIEVDSNNQSYQDIDGNLYTKDGTTILQYATGKADTQFVIPASVTSIGNAAFYECPNLTSITIPNSVTSIGENAFAHCSNLTSITIPNSVTTIGERAFYGCLSLTNITIPDSVTSIEDYTFCNCTGLKEVTIPNSVTSIGKSAFFATYVQNVYYYGTREQWAAISIGDNNKQLTNVKRHYLGTETPEVIQTIRAGVYRFRSELVDAPIVDDNGNGWLEFDLVTTTEFELDGIRYSAKCSTGRVGKDSSGTTYFKCLCTYIDPPYSSVPGWQIPYANGWGIDSERLFHVLEDTEVSVEAYDWFTKNALEQRPISGVWMFYEDIESASDYDEFHYYSDGSPHEGIGFDYVISGICGDISFSSFTFGRIWVPDGSTVDVYGIAVYSDDQSGWYVPWVSRDFEYEGHLYSAGWQDSAYRTVDFGKEPQYVSINFYNWITDNAERMLSGTWKFNDTVLPPTTQHWVTGMYISNDTVYLSAIVSWDQYLSGTALLYCTGYYPGIGDADTVITYASGEVKTYIEETYNITLSEGWQDEAYKTITFAASGFSGSFGEWFIQNVTPVTNIATISYNGLIVATLELGQTVTLECKGKQSKTDIVFVNPNSDT